ncbi:MAG TPA: glycosyltransferase family 1 protein [Longimicrobium sp.]|uniref:glycosyltransferase family 4 protein n=1 Tax=Longimicrobium sp. TaxID=2029185 RepID=UPI002EDA3F01
MTRRVAVVYDYDAEQWPSMALAGDLLVDGLRQHAPHYEPVALRPEMPRPVSRLFGQRARNADRFAARHLAYPRWLRRHGSGFPLYHVVDHSYAQLVHALPAERTVVTCHDLDAFRSLLPDPEPRPAWFRMMMRRVLTGLTRAAHVVCDSDAVRQELLAHRLADERRVTTVPLAAHPDFDAHPDPATDARAAAMLGPSSDGVADLLHVGSTVPRKRIELLLLAVAPVLAADPRLRLVRVGGPLTAPQRALAERLGIAGRMVELPSLERRTLAAVYRRAALVVNPSAREGFGLPLVEAMACGVPVLASDLPVFREVGADSVRYVAGDDASAWSEAIRAEVHRTSDSESRGTARAAALARAERFTLARYAAGIAAVYDRVLAGTA